MSRRGAINAGITSRLVRILQGRTSGNAMRERCTLLHHEPGGTGATAVSASATNREHRRAAIRTVAAWPSRSRRVHNYSRRCTYFFFNKATVEPTGQDAFVLDFSSGTRIVK